MECSLTVKIVNEEVYVNSSVSCFQIKTLSFFIDEYNLKLLNCLLSSYNSLNVILGVIFLKNFKRQNGGKLAGANCRSYILVEYFTSTLPTYRIRRCKQNYTCWRNNIFLDSRKLCVSSFYVLTVTWLTLVERM